MQHVIGQILHMVIGQRDALRVERIRFDDIGVRAEILAVDFLDDRGLRQNEQIVIALDVLRVILKAFAAIVTFAELVFLDHRAHGTVDDQNALACSLFQRCPT